MCIYLQHRQTSHRVFRLTVHLWKSGSRSLVNENYRWIESPRIPILVGSVIAIVDPKMAKLWQHCYLESWKLIIVHQYS